MLKITKENKNNSAVLGLEGRLDTTTAPELETEIKGCVDKIDSLILDFKGLKYISSAGLRVLLSTYKIMNKKGGMIIQNANEEIMEVFDITGFNDILTIE